eukprot:2247131-Pyramimonas_sp.AAC.1
MNLALSPTQYNTPWPHGELHRSAQWDRPGRMNLAFSPDQYSGSWPHHRRPQWDRTHAFPPHPVQRFVAS